MSAAASNVVPVFAPDVPRSVADFLSVPTPETWLDWAGVRLDELLIDHANCEKKAASTALGMLYRYPDRPSLVYRMSRLAREELRHFEQVCAILSERAIAWRPVPASRYASLLRDGLAAEEPTRLSDLLIVGAFIEARSCERFAALLPRLDASLSRFYGGLLASEARHFEHYLTLARDADPGDFDARVQAVRVRDARAVTEPDCAFSFHSGPPASADAA